MNKEGMISFLGSGECLFSFRNMKRFKNKIAVVTGGGKGIGKAIAERIASEGGQVAIWEKDLKSGKSAARKIMEDGGRAEVFHCDVGKRASVAKAAKETMKVLGCPTILVNNAGIAHIGDVVSTKEEDFNEVMQINAKGTFLCLKQIIPLMLKAGGGSILNVASIGSKLGIADRFAYSASKGAVLAMTLSVAKDFVNQGIRCNCICPARVHTPFVDGFLEKFYPDHAERVEKFEELSDYQPIGRMGQPEEIANLVAFLCSEEASFITGVTYDVDGGVINLK